MTLVDTSVWVDFFRGITRASTLGDLLETNEIHLHPWVLGELVLGGLGPPARGGHRGSETASYRPLRAGR